MTVRVALTGGVELQVQGDLDELTEALREALAKDKVLTTQLPDGQRLVLNPHHILFMVPAENGAMADRPEAHVASPAGA